MKLIFGDADVYNILYQALLASQRGLDSKLGEVRMAANILTAMETIGVATEERSNLGVIRLYKLRNPGDEMQLEIAEFNLLCELFDSVSWRPALAREVYKAQRFLDAIRAEL